MKKKLKNWYVEFATIKGGANGLINMTNYINNESHINHQKLNHEIISYEKNPDVVLKNILHIQQKKDNQVLLSRKGGRPASFGKSLMVSFPPEIKLSNNEYKSINNKVILRLIKFINDENRLNYNAEQMMYVKQNFILSSLHKQPNNDHLNIIIPNVFIEFGNNHALKRIDLGKRKYATFVKNTVNKLMLEIGYDYLDYQVKSQRTHRGKTSKLNHKISELNSSIEKSINDVEKLQQLFTDMNFLKDISTQLQKRISVYINRMKTALEENDKTKYEKNLELANKSYNKLKSKVEGDEYLEKLSKFEKLKRSIEDKKVSTPNITKSPQRN